MKEKTNTKLQTVEVKRCMPVWTPLQYYLIVAKITKFFRSNSKLNFRIDDEYLTRNIVFYNKQFQTIKIEPQFVKGTNKVWRLRVSCWLEIYFLTPNNSSIETIAEKSKSVLKEFEECISNAMYYELNPDTDSWRFKRVVFP